MRGTAEVDIDPITKAALQELLIGENKVLFCSIDEVTLQLWHVRDVVENINAMEVSLVYHRRSHRLSCRVWVLS